MKIKIGSHILEKDVLFQDKCISRFALIADDHVAELYGKQLCSTWKSQGVPIDLFSFAPGEQNKTRRTKEQLEDQLLEKGFSRDSCIIALGGGITTDLAGYVAATFCRGIPLVMIPTTLLAMVDSSIGGKVGVNVPFGKNLVGAFHQPSAVWIDTHFLKTLPEKEMLSGVVEMIKHGLIADAGFVDFLEKSLPLLMQCDEAALQQAIEESCKIKLSIVNKDEKESGKRRLLNFGHTIGHALEHVTDYALSHGEAVALGILVESYMGVQQGVLSQDAFTRIQRLFNRYRLQSPIDIESMVHALLRDKKGKGGKPRFVCLKEIGVSDPCGGNWCCEMPEGSIQEALKWMNHALYRD